MQFIRYFILLPLLGLSLLTKAQLGGKYTYEFLDLPTGSRIAALGGDIVPIFDKDLSLAINNPSLLNSQMNNYILFHVSDYHTDIKYGTVAYAKSFKKGITAMADIQYINYGDFLKQMNLGILLVSLMPKIMHTNFQFPNSFLIKYMPEPPLNLFLRDWKHTIRMGFYSI